MVLMTLLKIKLSLVKAKNHVVGMAYSESNQSIPSSGTKAKRPPFEAKGRTFQQIFDTSALYQWPQKSQLVVVGDCDLGSHQPAH